MRSRSNRRRAVAFVLPMLTVALLASSGCQLNRSFFQMDSNSRVPFFGVDLAPKWPKRSSSVDGVSRLQSNSSNAETRERTAGELPPERLTLPLADATAATLPDDAPVELFR